MEVPYDVQLTEDKLPGELCMLLDGVVDDTAKVAVLLMMVQHLGHESGWGPYAKSLPCKDQMHNLILERFPHLFGEVSMEGFMHASALVSSRAWRTSRGVSLVIADRNYAVGEQVMIRYGKYSNATLALNFGFTLSRNIYDQARILVDMRDQEPLWAKKIDIWEKHRHPKYEDMPSCSWSKDSFVIKGVKSTKGKGMGVPEILRAFFRVFGATSPEDLFEMTVEATRTDGRLARRPLENIEKEIQAHRMLLLHLHDKIQTYSTAIEQLESVNDPSSRSVHPFRKEMAKDLIVGELRVLQSAHSRVSTYCECLRKS